MKNITKTQFRKMIIKAINNEIADHREHLLIRSILFKHEGKQLSMHFKKYLPENMSLNISVANSYQIKVDNERTHYLGYNRNDFTIESFYRHDAPYSSGAKERFLKLKNVLKNDDIFLDWFKYYKKIVSIFNDISELNNMNKNASFYFPAHYEIMRNILKDMNFRDDDKRDLTSIIK